MGPPHGEHEEVVSRDVGPAHFFPSNTVFLHCFMNSFESCVAKKQIVKSFFLLNAWLFFKPDFLSSKEIKEEQPAYHLIPRRPSVEKHLERTAFQFLVCFFDSCDKI